MPSEASGTFPFNHRASEEAWERCCSAELCRKQRSVRALFLGLSFEGVLDVLKNGRGLKHFALQAKNCFSKNGQVLLNSYAL